MFAKMILKSNTVQKLKKSLIENYIFCAVKLFQICKKICTLVSMKVLNTNLTSIFKDFILKI